jgi:hypothetical protein
MGTKNAPGKFDCYAAADPDEPMFVLLGRDPSAGALVRFWARMRFGSSEDPDKLEEALSCADALDAWAKKLGKVPRVYATVEPHQAPIHAGMSARLRDFPGPRLGVRRILQGATPNGDQLYAEVFYFDAEGVMHETKFRVEWLVAFDAPRTTAEIEAEGGVVLRSGEQESLRKQALARGQ